MHAGFEWGEFNHYNLGWEALGNLQDGMTHELVPDTAM